MAWVVEVPVLDDVGCTFLRPFEVFAWVALGLVFFTIIHKQVAEYRLPVGIAHFVEFLEPDVHPFGAVGPVAHYFVALVFQPFFVANLAILEVLFARQVGF